MYNVTLCTLSRKYSFIYLNLWWTVLHSSFHDETRIHQTHPSCVTAIIQSIHVLQFFQQFRVWQISSRLRYCIWSQHKSSSVSLSNTYSLPFFSVRLDLSPSLSSLCTNPLWVCNSRINSTFREQETLGRLRKTILNRLPSLQDEYLNRKWLFVHGQKTVDKHDNQRHTAWTVRSRNICASKGNIIDNNYICQMLL